MRPTIRLATCYGKGMDPLIPPEVRAAILADLGFSSTKISELERGLPTGALASLALKRTRDNLYAWAKDLETLRPFVDSSAGGPVELAWTAALVEFKAACTAYARAVLSTQSPTPESVDVPPDASNDRP